MPPPAIGSFVTQAQINNAVNRASFQGAVPGNAGWHLGQFEPWALTHGYPGGAPIYGHVSFQGMQIHIYYLPALDRAIILRMGQTPAQYGF